MTQNDNIIKWESRYDEWKDSGLNVAAWCREQGVNDKQMYYWIRKLENKNAHPQQQNPPNSWMPVQLDSPIEWGACHFPEFVEFC